MLKRSHAFDLLFDDSQEQRVHDIHEFLESPERVDASVPLHRVTIFVTYGCNLDCPYCKTIARTNDDVILFPQKAGTFTYESFRRVFDSLQGTPISHLHFTGGEPTLVRDLPKMVLFAKNHDVQHCSLTSNGTLPLSVYAREALRSCLDHDAF